MPEYPIPCGVQTDAITHESWGVVLDAVPESALLARRHVAAAFREWGLEDMPARMAVTELMSNAVRHGSGPGDTVAVRVSRAGEGPPVIEVADHSDALPVMLPDSVTRESGRGLALMARIVRGWGARPLPGGGKAVLAVIEPVAAVAQPETTHFPGHAGVTAQCAITCLPLSARTHWPLTRHVPRLKTVAQVVRLVARGRLRDVRGIGAERETEILKALAEAGLTAEVVADLETGGGVGGGPK